MAHYVVSNIICSLNRHWALIWNCFTDTEGPSAPTMTIVTHKIIRVDQCNIHSLKEVNFKVWLDKVCVFR